MMNGLYHTLTALKADTPSHSFFFFHLY